MSIQFVKSTEDFNKYVSRNKYLVANFTASWCGPCQAIKPVVDQLYSDSNQRYESIEVVRIDLDSQRDLAAKYQISSVPTFVFIENGKENTRVSGANIPELIKNLDEMNAKATSEGEPKPRAGNGTSSTIPPVTDNVAYKEIKSLIPKGFETLNDSIDFGEFQALNVLPLYKSNKQALHNVFKLTSAADTKSIVLSDADSQLLFFIPFLNLSKVYSILIKFKNDLDKLEVEEGQELELDEDELNEETQLPNVIKVFTNQFNIPTFDEASSAQAPHMETIEKVEGSDWYEAKLKFVRFQSVQSLTLFFDGVEEDYHTLIEKLVIVGLSGETKEQGSVNKLEDEE